jgi:hypothetical protein
MASGLLWPILAYSLSALSANALRFDSLYCLVIVRNVVQHTPSFLPWNLHYGAFFLDILMRAICPRTMTSWGVNRSRVLDRGTILTLLFCSHMLIDLLGTKHPLGMRYMRLRARFPPHEYSEVLNIVRAVSHLDAYFSYPLPSNIPYHRKPPDFFLHQSLTRTRGRIRC